MNPQRLVRFLLLVVGAGFVLLGVASVAAHVSNWESPVELAALSESDTSTPLSTQTPFHAFPPEGGQITIFAAASLTEAFNEIKRTLESAHPELTVNYNFAGSQALVTQLKEGAAADVLAAADTSLMDDAAEAGLSGGDATVFAHNRMTIVTPLNNPAGIQRPADLAEEGLLLVLARPEVPAGRYARESLRKMATDTETYGAGFWDRVTANVVSEEEDVRGVLAKVALGEADAGIVYVSDAAAGDGVNVVAIPDDVNVMATYPVVALAGSNKALSSAFISYLVSDEGQATLAAFGFEPVG